MPAERSGGLAVSPEWADGWCRTTAPEDQSRNPKLADRIHVPALPTAATCPACSSTKAPAQAQHRQTQARHDASHSNRNEARTETTTSEQTTAHRQPAAAANEPGITARRYMSNSFLLSEVRKALRHHPESLTALRIHFDELADRLEAENAGPQDREHHAA